MSSNPSTYKPRFGTRDPEEMERLIKYIQELADELGHKPRKTDLDPDELGRIKSCFGKWVYALEAAGLQTPSQGTIKRRNTQMSRWKRKHEASKKRNRIKKHAAQKVKPSGQNAPDPSKKKPLVTDDPDAN